MKFALEILQLVTLPDCSDVDEVIGSHPSVDVTWEQYGSNDPSTAMALADGKEVARLRTFDDYPIEIYEDQIKIEGIVDEEAKEPRTTFGTWILREVEKDDQRMRDLQKLYGHLVKRVFDDYGVEVTPEWEQRVLSGEHDVPLPD